MSARPTSHPLRVLVVTEADPLYVIRFFEIFFESCPRDRIELVGVTIAKAFDEPLWRTARRMLRFYGLLDFLRVGARWFGALLRRRSIAGLAREAGVRLIDTGSVNDPAYEQRVRDLTPDVIVSVAAPERFREAILGVPRLGCINIHAGRLPRYRGMMPNFWQLLHGEEDAVITVHEMVLELDAGGILATRAFPLRPRDSLDRVITGTKHEGARLMIEVLLRMAEDDVVAVPLDMEDAGYHAFPSPADVRAFRDRGHRML